MKPMSVFDLFEERTQRTIALGSRASMSKRERGALRGLLLLLPNPCPGGKWLNMVEMWNIQTANFEACRPLLVGKTILRHGTPIPSEVIE